MISELESVDTEIDETEMGTKNKEELEKYKEERFHEIIEEIQNWSIPY